MDIKKATVAFGLMAAVYAGAAKYEAESATLAGGAAAKSSSSASGGSYVQMKEGNISFSVNESSAGKYTLTFHYMADTKKINDIKINGASAGSVTFPQASAFTDVPTIVNLKAGTNTIDIVKNWGWIDLDYIELTPFEAGSFNLCNAPTTKNATASAVKLYNFLVNNFGQKTISGVMTGNMDNYTMGDVTKHEDVQAVFSAGGKYPALVGVDLMNATGANKNESWFKEYTQKALDVAKSIWTKGGIPSITWHWRPGSETQFYTKEANRSEGFTAFDFTKAFMTGTTTWDTLSTTYQTLVADMDVVAGYMLELQEAGVAAIFRPLHESGGNWFWWSSHSGAQFAALYRLLYERLVFKKGVKNLVWVFNPQDATLTDWDPGSTYYDVRGVDIYNNANDHSSNSSAFFDYMLNFGTDKVLALSENGPIPDVTNMHNDGSVWSWWMPWYQSWSSGYVSQTANSVWQQNLSSDKIITLDEMPGWANYSTANSGTKTCNTASETANYNGNKEPSASTPTSSNSTSSNSNNTAIGTATVQYGTTLTLQGSSLAFTTVHAGSVSLDVFDLQGNRVATLYRGVLSAGTHQFSLAEMARGSYIVRAKGAGIAATKRVVVR